MNKALTVRVANFGKNAHTPFEDWVKLQGWYTGAVHNMIRSKIRAPQLRLERGEAGIVCFCNSCYSLYVKQLLA